VIRMPYFRTKDGCRIYYETQDFESSKPVVVFLNGTMQNTLYWKTPSVAFRERFRILTYDARAQGQSDMGNLKLSLEGHAADLAALLDYLDIEKAHLVGLSHGAKVALAYAVNSIERVDRLVLCSVAAGFTCRGKLIVRSWLEILKNSGIEKMAWASLAVAFGEDFLKRKEKILGALVEAIVRRNKKEFVICQLEAMTAYPPLSKVARNLHIPCLVISGSDDPFVTEEGAEQLAVLCGGQHKHIMRTGHSIPIERAELFGKIVVEFLCET
jgi:3-oxoadipate enol-lactonase